MRIPILLSAIMFALSSTAQVSGAYQFSDEPLDFSPFQTVYKAEVDMRYTENQGSMIKHFYDIKKEMMHGELKPYTFTKTSGGIVLSADNSTVRQTQRKASSAAQKQYEKQVSDAKHQAFLQQQAERREAARQAAIEAHNRKVERERQERLLDEARTAAERARMTAQLQGRTNQKMQNDQWHATTGKQVVRQVARQEIGKPQGMNVVRTQPVKTSGSTLATRMRDNQNRSRSRMPQPGGIEYYSRRPMPPVVRQKPNASGKYVFTGRATKSQIFIEKDKNIQIAQVISGPSLAKGGSEFRLDPHATVTTGQDWHSIDFKQPTEKPAPVFKPRERRLPRPIVTFTREISYEEKLEELFPDEHTIF